MPPKKTNSSGTKRKYVKKDKSNNPIEETEESPIVITDNVVESELISNNQIEETEESHIDIPYDSYIEIDNEENEFENIHNKIDINNFNKNIYQNDLPVLEKNEYRDINEINSIINELVVENEDINKYILNETSLNNILDDLPSQKYTFDDLKNIFNQFNEAVMLIQIMDGKIKFIEKKGYESRNQSVIELLIKTNNYKPLPSISFLIFTNDFIESDSLKDHTFIYTFCKNSTYNTTLFPNFNFNNWNEAQIGNYEDTYNFFKDNQIEWTKKSNTIFWSGADTNIIRKKMFLGTIGNILYDINLTNITKKFIPITNITKHKYLLNMNGYSYSGRLNYLFLSGSCVIQLKNTNPTKSYDEFYYKYFIPDLDYIEIPYNDNTHVSDILNIINEKLVKLDPEVIAQNGFKKAIEILNIYNIYEYIHQSLTKKSVNYNALENNSKSNNILDQSIMYIPNKNIYFNRIPVINNSVNFTFKGNDIIIKLSSESNNFIFSFLYNILIIIFNGTKIYNKKIPQLNLNQNIYNNINIEFNSNNIIIKNNNIVIVDMPFSLFNIINTEFSTSKPSWIIY